MKTRLLKIAGTLLITSALFNGSAYANSSTSLLEQQVKLLDHDDANEVVSEAEPNNTVESANETGAGDILHPVTVKGTLPIDDIDWYKVKLDSDAPLSLYGSFGQESSDIPLDITLYNEARQKIEPFDYFVDEEDGFWGLYPTAPGTYYISVKNKNALGIGKEYILATSQFYFEPHLERIYGTDRYETALQAALKGWESGSENMILATGANFPDALAGAPLAYEKDAPILLTSKLALHPTVKKAIKDLAVKKVTVLGGTGVISDHVLEEIEDLGVTVTRIGGKDRYETAAFISKLLPNHEAVVIVNGRNYPDALSIASIAAQKGYPILLSQKSSIPTATLTQAKQYQKTYVIGGTGVVDQSIMSKLMNPIRVAGMNRYETNASVMKQFKENMGSFFIATGTEFADALTGSALAAHSGKPLLLTSTEKLHPAVRNLMIDYAYDVTILGGEKAISPNTEEAIWSVLESNNE